MRTHTHGDDDIPEPGPDAGAPPQSATPGPLLTAEPAPAFSAPPTPPPYWAQRDPIGAALLLFASALIPVVCIVLAIKLLRKTSGKARRLIFGLAMGGWAVLALLGLIATAVSPSANGDPPEAPFYAVGYKIGLRLVAQYRDQDAQTHCTDVADRIGNDSSIPAGNWQNERPFFVNGCVDGFRGNANRYPNQPLPTETAPVNQQPAAAPTGAA